MASDIMLGGDDDPTITLVGEGLNIETPSGEPMRVTGDMLLRGELIVRSPVAAPPVSRFSGVSIARGVTEPVTSTFGPLTMAVAVADIGYNVWDELTAPREYVDLVKEVRWLRGAVLEVNARLKAMGV